MINSELLKFKGAGTKILTEIGSNTPQAQMPDGSRILVINSRKGEVNNLVRVDSFAEYLTKFDGISDADERRGNWSARSAQIMLEVAPIYVINLRSFDDTVDKAGFQEISMSTNIKNGVNKEKPYSKLFNTSQFWKVDPSALITNQNADKLLVFGNIGTSNISVFVRKTRTVQPTITFDTWYKNLNREMPAYVNPLDEVGSWFVDVVMFKNTFNSGANSNINYGYCFNEDGSIKSEVVNNAGQTVDAITQLTSIPESGYITTITGSLVQGFTSSTNVDMDIVSLVNSLVPQTGLLVARNENIFDNASIWYEGDTPFGNEMKRPIAVDFKGHNLCNITEIGTFALDQVPQSVQVASYKYNTTISEEEVNVFNLSYDEVTFIGYENNELPKDTIVKYNAFFKGNLASNGKIEIASKNKIYIFGDNSKPSIKSNFVGFDGNLASVTGIKMVATSKVIDNVASAKLAIQPIGTFSTLYSYVNGGKLFPKDPNGEYFVYPNDHLLAGKPLAFVNKDLTEIYHLPTPTPTFYLDPKSGISVADYVDILLNIDDYEGDEDAIITADMFSVNAYAELEDATILQDLIADYGKPNNIYEVSFDKDLAINGETQDDEVEFLPITNEYGAYKSLNGEDLYFYGNGHYVFKVADADENSKSYQPINLASYKVRNSQFLDGTAQRQKEVLDVLIQKNFKDALSNRDLTNWNYIVDGFKSYIEPNIKYQLKEVAKSRIIARAIYNMPSIADFAKSTNPYFSKEIGGNLEIEYITKGGNLELPHNNSFSLPSESGWYAYGFGPNLTISGTTKTMPPASVVSNLFQNKHLVGKPYMILAGKDQGAIRVATISGVEYIFNETNDGKGDRDFLDPFGYNVIVHKRSGLQIYSNKTSHNTVSTPVSAIHSSEVLMYIQQRINNMLENFVFAINNSQNRMIIKKQADDICQEAFAEGAISGYVNKMDKDNNTNEVIANKIGVLDTTIYDSNGMEILIHRTKFDTVTNMAEFEVVSSNI